MTDEQIVPMLTAWQEWHIKSGISIEDIPPPNKFFIMGFIAGWDAWDADCDAAINME